MNWKSEWDTWVRKNMTKRDIYAVMGPNSNWTLEEQAKYLMSQAFKAGYEAAKTPTLEELAEAIQEGEV